MQQYESFGECLKRCLKEAELSASEAARLVGFRSRNSIFRILSGETSDDVNLRFFSSLHKALGSAWPEKQWLALQQALSVDRLGPDRYRAYRAFERMLYAQEKPFAASVERLAADDSRQRISLDEVLGEIAGSQRAEIVITGCCDSGLTRLLAERCGAAGEAGRLNIRHYIDTAESVVTQNIMAILPLVSKPWYNARLVEPGGCAEEMQTIFRLNALYVRRWNEAGQLSGEVLVRYDAEHFTGWMGARSSSGLIDMLDRWRFKLELLKPLPQLSDGTQAFVEYTEQYRQLEKDCTICSIKPDVHFNCIPTDVLEQAIIEGFQQTGMAAGPELAELIDALRRVHDERYTNMVSKHKPTHLVYSLPVMKRFMCTGVQTDHFFIQRAYTVEERRRIVQDLLDTMCKHPWFNVYFLKENAPELCNEITFYDGKGVLMLDAYTGYELDADHSEALITLPAFMESFHSYFMNELLKHHVMSRAETLQALEGLLVMNVQE